MKFNQIFSIAGIGILVFSGSCKKDQNPNLPSQAPHQEESTMSTLAAVNLRDAGDFAILSKTGITDVYKSEVTGDVGTSPITGAAIHLTCSEVSGKIYSVNAAGPLPCRITNASWLSTSVGDMQTAYTDAAGRTSPNFLNLGAGNIGG